jgi:acyl-CoA dehydrogenase
MYDAQYLGATIEMNTDKPQYSITEELSILAEGVRRFLDEHAPSESIRRWRANGMIDRELWRRAAAAGLLCPSIPSEYGGAGGDFRHETAILREIILRGLDGWGLPLHNGIIAPYILNYASPAQKREWLPRLARGELIGAIAMTEPGTGSDLQAIRTRAVIEDDSYRISGTKTFITNGQTANFIILVAKTGAAPGAGSISLIGVETDRSQGFRRGRNLEKLGLEIGDTSELFFDDVRVPRSNLLGETEGQGFEQLMQQLPRERLLIAIECLAIIDRALEVTISYVRERQAFGKPIIEFQNTSFVLAAAKTEATVTKVFVDHCIQLLLDGSLDASTASMAKLWSSEAAQRIVDQCLQLHGGYGYMTEYPIAQMYKDVRVKRIYGGTSEIMKLLIARSL